MRSAGRFVIGIIGNALALILAIVLLPYGFQAANKLFPSMSGEIQIQSTVLKQSLENSARLETATVDEEGVLIAETNVIILGTVGKSVITYRYQGSFGIDLRKVNIELSGNDMTFILPPVEVMMDKIEPIDINQNNFFSYRIDKSTSRRLDCRLRQDPGASLYQEGRSTGCFQPCLPAVPRQSQRCNKCLRSVRCIRQPCFPLSRGYRRPLPHPRAACNRCCRSR